MIGRLDPFLPVSGVVCFVEAGAKRTGRAVAKIAARQGWPVDSEPAGGDFPDVLRALEPIDGRRHLVVGSRDGAWSAVFQGHERPDLDSLAWNLMRDLRARCVTVTSAPTRLDEGGASTLLQVHDPSVDRDEAVRVVGVLRAERWTFVDQGERLPFEDAAAYRARRKQDRLPPELLDRYVEALGVPAPDAAHWGPGALLLTRRRAQDPTHPTAWATIAELNSAYYGAR